MNRFEKISKDQFIKDTADLADGLFYEYHDGAIPAAFFYDKVAIPRRSTAKSAGYDFVSPVPAVVLPGRKARIATGIKCRLDDGCVLLVDVRSGLGVKGLSLSNTIGVIDADYYNNKTNEGDIIMWLENRSNDKIEIKSGDRIAQGIIVRFETTADDDAGGERTGGFGSTGERSVA